MYWITGFGQGLIHKRHLIAGRILDHARDQFVVQHIVTHVTTDDLGTLG